MENNLKRMVPLLIFALLFSKNLVAQVPFMMGYIVTNSNDTIKCYIQDKDPREFTTLIYKLSKSDTKTIKLKKENYRRVFMGGMLFDRVEVKKEDPVTGGENTIIKVLKVEAYGFTKIYSFRRTAYVGGPGGDSFAYFIQKGEEPAIRIPKLAFSNILKEQLKEWPNLEENLEEKGFGYTSIPVLITKFNTWYRTK